jgi:hypothetical protein
MVLASAWLVLAPAPARADSLVVDSMLQLVREIAAEPVSRPTVKTSKAGAAERRRCAAGKPAGAKRHKARTDRRSPRSRHKRGPAHPRVHLTAAARGSGRIDVIDAGGPVSVAEHPAIEAKPGL